MILCGGKGCCSCSSVKGLVMGDPGLHRWILNRIIRIQKRKSQEI